MEEAIQTIYLDLAARRRDMARQAEMFKHVLDQQLRIERQRELLAKLERDGHPDILTDARRLLVEMERALASMKDHYTAAQERLAQASVDGPSLAKVEKDAPM